MKRPNILFLTSHDTGDWLGCYGHPTVNTPHLDALAAQGCRFANSFCTSPVSTPSRGAMMTGRYPQSNGLMGLIQTPYRWCYNPGERHLSHLLAEGGYHTVLFNHQHEAPHGETLGFRERHLDFGTHPLHLHHSTVATADATAERVISWLEGAAPAERPFYAQIGFFETHTPFAWSGATPDSSRGVEVPPWVADTAEMRHHIAGLQGAVRSLDAAIGRILGALKETGLDANTLVIFTVDHGAELPRSKWELYDGGIRTALLARWPEGGIRGGRECKDLVSNVDIVPTVLALAGLALPNNLQGQSRAPSMRGANAPADEAVFAMMHRHDRWIESRCVRTARHKLIRNFSPCRVIPQNGPAITERPVLELYDLKADPCELNNLGASEAHAAIRRELDRRLLDWLREVRDPILDGPVQTPYYRMAMADWQNDPGKRPPR